MGKNIVNKYLIHLIDNTVINIIMTANVMFKM